MSYTCYGCGNAQLPGARPIFKRLAVRIVKYLGHHSEKSEFFCDFSHDGEGFETAPGGEVKLCARCITIAPDPQIMGKKTVNFPVIHRKRRNSHDAEARAGQHEQDGDYAEMAAARA